MDHSSSNSVSVSVIAVSETWLKPGLVSLYTIPDYSFIAQSRTSVGGGVGLYIQSDYAWKQRDDSVLDGTDFNVKQILL